MSEPIRAYRIPISETSIRNRICWRCGNEFDATHLIDSAPCADCRYFLAGEGDRTIYDTRTDRFKLPTALRDELVMKMVQDGITAAAIAEHMDVHVRTITRTIRRLTEEQDVAA